MLEAGIAGRKSLGNVLEPTAGDGAIADAIRDSRLAKSLEVMEINRSRANVLARKGHNIVGSDFFNYTTPGKPDTIFINPPFSDGQSRTFFAHSYNTLKPGGRLVAIMPRSVYMEQSVDRPSHVMFDKWLKDHNAVTKRVHIYSPELKDSGRISVNLITVDKPINTAGVAE
jgi:hypothetical protein